MSKKDRTASKPMWAYAYQIVPPHLEGRLDGVKALLAREHAEAERASRVWEGRFVEERQVTHILVVSDSPDQDGEANRRLEAALTAAQAGFVVTAPLAVDDRPVPPPVIKP
jgi:hypothetical protein